MPDIKTIDKSVIAAQRIKNAYVQAKEKTERTPSLTKESPEEYAANQVSDGTNGGSLYGASFLIHHLTMSQ